MKNSEKHINLKCEKEYSLIKNKNDEINYSLSFHLPHQINQVKENEIVGTVEIVVEGVVVETINILSCNTYLEPTIWDNFKKIINT